MDNDLRGKSTLGDYELLSEIGRDNLGSLYHAHERALNRSVILRVLPPQQSQDKAAAEAFMRAAKTAAQLDHPNILAVHSVGQDRGVYYVAMEHVPGRTLAERLRESGPLGQCDAVRIVQEVADALAAAHEHGVIHQDIRPENVLLDAHGHAKLMGFAWGADSPTPKQPFHSQAGPDTAPHYSPGESVSFQVDQRQTIRVLGMMLRALLEGGTAFRSKAPAPPQDAVRQAAGQDTTATDRAVSAEVVQLVSNMIGNRSQAGYGSMRDLCVELKAVAAALRPALPSVAAPAYDLQADLASDLLGKPTSVPETAGSSAAARPRSTSKIVYVVAAIVLLLLGLGAAFLHAAARRSGGESSVDSSRAESDASSATVESPALEDFSRSNPDDIRLTESSSDDVGEQQDRITNWDGDLAGTTWNMIVATGAEFQLEFFEDGTAYAEGIVPWRKGARRDGGPLRDMDWEQDGNTVWLFDPDEYGGHHRLVRELAINATGTMRSNVGDANGTLASSP